ncbi:MAG TPA: YegS/Rv2252/BmrU family lipid kinase [Allocoleopsis sp.]
MRHIIYIINPVSGTRNKRDIRSVIESKTTAAGVSFDIFPSVASGDYSFLDPVIRSKKTTDIIIAGGDGTVSQVVGSLMKHDLNFGIIPCGSGNGLAFTAKIPRRADLAIDVALKGYPVPTDGFYLNQQFACMLCGLGFDARIAHDFAQQPKRGLTTYVKQVVRNFFSAKSWSFEITVKGKKIDTEAYFICIANSNQFGNNFKIAPKASLSDGLLDIVIVAKQNKLKWLLQMLKQLRGKNELAAEGLFDEKKAVLYFQAEELEIVNKSQAPLHIDGEPAETPDTVKISIRKKCFRLLQPS